MQIYSFSSFFSGCRRWGKWRYDVISRIALGVVPDWTGLRNMFQISIWESAVYGVASVVWGIGFFGSRGLRTDGWRDWSALYDLLHTTNV